MRCGVEKDLKRVHSEGISVEAASVAVVLGLSLHSAQPQPHQCFWPLPFQLVFLFFSVLFFFLLPPCAVSLC